MATTAWTITKSGGTETDGGQCVFPVSVRGNWFTIHSNLEATADAAAVLIAPLTSTNTGLLLVKVPSFATRLIIRGKYTTAGTSGSNATIRLIGLDSYVESAGVGALDTSTTGMVRLDGDNVDVGTEIEMAAATDIGDGTNSFTDSPEPDGYDLKGCASVIVLLETAGALTSGTMLLQGRFLN